MRRALALLVAFGAFAAPAHATTVYVGNHSTSTPQQAVEATLPAFQTMIDRDLGPAWNVHATLTTDPAAEKTADMRLYIEENANCTGCLGFHDAVDGKPIAYIFAADCAAWHDDLWLVEAHELQEMLVDPWVNRFALWNKRQWLVEVSDPVESGFYAYFIDGVPMSDFVLPAWYGAPFVDGPKGPFDFTRKLRRAGQIGRHGYASYLDPWTGWEQVFA